MENMNEGNEIIEEVISEEELENGDRTYTGPDGKMYTYDAELEAFVDPEVEYVELKDQFEVENSFKNLMTKVENKISSTTIDENDNELESEARHR